MTTTEKKIQGVFYPLTPEMSQKLRKAKLTKHEMALWLYLVEKDPFGDRYWPLPPVLEVITELEMSKASYFRARARLQELELFDFQEQRVDCRNLTGVSKMRLQSQKLDSKSQKLDTRTPEALPALNSSNSQTYSDLNQTNTEEDCAIQTELESVAISFSREEIFQAQEEIQIQEEAVPTPPASLIDRSETQASNHQPSPGVKIPTSTENDSHSQYSSAQRCDDRFNHTRKNLPPHLASWKRGDWHPDFVEFVRKRLSGTKYYFDTLRREATTGDAKSHLNGKNATPDGKATIEDVYIATWQQEIKAAEEKRLEEDRSLCEAQQAKEQKQKKVLEETDENYEFAQRMTRLYAKKPREVEVA